MLVDIPADHVRVELKIGDGAIAVAGEFFGAVDGVVEVEHAAGEALEDVDDALVALGMVLALDEGAGGNGAGIHHRVERPVVLLVEDDGVEGLAGGLDPDAFQHLVTPVILKRQGVDHGLRYRLDGELRFGVADLVEEAVGRCEGDGEAIRRNGSQFRDVACEFTGGVRQVAAVEVVEVAPYRQVVRRNIRRPQALILHIEISSAPKFQAN